MQCPGCGANRLPQYGRSRGRQTYRCDQRRYHFVPGAGRPRQPEQLKAQSVALYAEGSMAASSRLLGIPEVRKELSVPAAVRQAPEGKEYRTDAYRVYTWLPANRRQVGRGAQ